MSLSVFSSAASYGKPLGYGLAGLSTVAAPGADASQRPVAAPSWSWTPTSTGSGRRDARTATLMAVLSHFPAPSADNPSGSSSGFGAPRDGTTSLPTSLDDRGATTTTAVASPGDSSQEIEWSQGQDLSQDAPSDVSIVTSSDTSGQFQSVADSATMAAEVKLAALFKTLQAYGL